jgi:hypothetical protein
MKLSRCILSCAAFLTLAPVVALAQDKPATESQAKEAPGIPLKLQMLLTEYDGTKKVASLPYTIFLMGSPEGKSVRGQPAQLRYGVRVPVSVSSKTGESSMQYLDVGTNVDARAAHAESDAYSTELTIERSSLVVRMENNQAKEWAAGDPSPSAQPLIREFRNSFTMLLHDGRTAEATVASDPTTGHVLKVELTLTVVK